MLHHRIHVIGCSTTSPRTARVRTSAVRSNPQMHLPGAGMWWMTSSRRAQSDFRNGIGASPAPISSSIIRRRSGGSPDAGLC
jgi:hypothetical protein